MSGKIIISWKNTYGAKISNINIQRSADSLRNFTTIGTVLEPTNRENGYADYKAPNNKVFYRVFIAFEGGRYIFTKSYRPVKDTASAIINLPPDSAEDSVAEEFPKPVVHRGYVPSKFIFTAKDNNVIISLPDAAIKKYSIKFFDEKQQPVFDINKITEPWLIIEKVNFLRSGWFFFELYQDGNVIEKHKFFVPKDGKHSGNHPERGRN